MSTLFRALLFFLTFNLVVIAITQVAGRVAFAFLDDAEPRINQLLEERGLRVEGARSAWRYLNPGVHVDAVSWPGGELRDVTIQLGLVESIVRSEWVLAAAQIGEVQLALERVDGRWRVVGLAGEGEPPPLEALIWHSDQLAADGTVELLADGQRDRYRVHARLENRGGAHRGEVRVAAGECDACEATLRYDVREAVPGLQPATRRVELTGSQLPLPMKSLVGSADARLQLAELDGRWRDDEGEGAGQLTLELVDARANGAALDALEVELHLAAEDSVLHGSFPRIALTLEEQLVEIDGVTARIGPAEIDVHAPMIDLNTLSPLLQSATAGVDRVGRWLRELNVRGSVQDLRWVRVTADEAVRSGYAARLRGIDMRGYRGAPALEGAHADLHGSGIHLLAEIDVREPVLTHFTEVFAEGWQLDRASGELEVWMQPGRFAISGTNLAAGLDGTPITGRFSVSQPQPRYDKRVALTLNAGKVSLRRAKSFIPYKLNPDLVRWLTEAPREGTAGNVSFAYQGQVHLRPAELGRRVALRAEVNDARMRYHEAWPEVAGIAGQLSVSGITTSFDVVAGVSMGVSLVGSELRVADNGDRVEGNLQADGDGAALLAFVRRSPLQQAMSFVTPAWAVEGPMRLDGPIRIPLRDAQNRKTDADLRVKLSGVMLEVPEFRSRFTELSGELQFRMPHYLSSEVVTGRLWEHPMEARASSDDETVRFQVTGHMTGPRVFSMVGMDDPGMLKGSFDYASVLTVGVKEAATGLTVSSDLLGLAVSAPSGIGKLAEERAPVDVSLRFQPEGVLTSFSYRSANGWVLVDGAPVRGAIGLGGPPPVLSDENLVLVNGKLDVVDVGEWAGGQDGGLALPFPWRVEGLKAQNLRVGELELPNVTLFGRTSDVGLEFDLASRAIKGHAVLPDEGPLSLDLDWLRIPAASTEGEPAAAEEATDPLSAALVYDLPEARFEVDEVRYGDDDFGAWRFALKKPEPGVALFENLSANVKGVGIEAPRVVWRAESNATSFEGVLRTEDLAEVLPQWDYAATLSSERSAVDASVSWPGSPLNVALTGLTGEVAFSADEGRFQDVEAAGGALRIMSLLNFSAIVKRLNLNFSDVVGKGLPYEDLDARVRLQAGDLTFLEPLQVSSTASEFRIGGRVDLVSGVLDNEMVVTLPVSRGLPWYGVYVALANPLAGLGVLVGERVLRKPLQQFSSAKYAVTGTLEEPEVRFVELFSTRMSEPDAEPDPQADESAGR